MKLYFVQHGLALSSAEDALRPLSEEGREAVFKISDWAQQAKLSVTEIYHSGKLRAEQTASIFAEYLSPIYGLHQLAGLAPNDDVSVIEKLIIEKSIVERSESIMFVGHLPFLNRLISSLLVGDIETNIVHFHNAAIICLQTEVDGDVAKRSLERNLDRELDWQLDWIMRPEHVI